MVLAIIVGSGYLITIKSKEISKTKALSKKLNDDVDLYAKALKFNGSILAVKNGNVMVSKAFGMANEEQKLPNTTKTKFMVGSITKQFTALSIMQLQEKGLLNVNDKIDKYIPGFPHGKEITIRQLLSHTSGLPRDTNEIKFDSIPSTFQEGLNMLKGKDIKLLCIPGEAYNYSNAGYLLLGYIVEKVSGETYSAYLNKHIFKPLKMDNSGCGYNRKENTNLAVGYTIAFTISATPKDFYDLSLSGFSAGGIYSTVDDLYKWDRALYTEKLVTKKTLNEIYTPVKSNYGYGWFISKVSNKTTYYHTGSILGFHSEIIRQVDNDIFIVVLSNEANDSFDFLAQKLVQDYSNK